MERKTCVHLQTIHWRCVTTPRAEVATILRTSAAYDTSCPTTCYFGPGDVDAMLAEQRQDVDEKGKPKECNDIPCMLYNEVVVSRSAFHSAGDSAIEAFFYVRGSSHGRRSAFQTQKAFRKVYPGRAAPPVVSFNASEAEEPFVFEAER